MWVEKSPLYQGETLELRFQAPNAPYLGVIDPTGHFFYIVFPAELSAGKLKPLVESRQFERLSTLTSPHAFRPWLYTLAIRAARRRVWTQRLREVALPAAEAPPLWRAEDLAPELSADERAQLVLLGQRLSRLPLPLRQAWVLRYQFDCTLPETAAACGCSLATAKRRIEEARQRLEGKT